MVETEIVKSRSSTMKVFDQGGGVRRYRCNPVRTPLHYLDSNKLFQDIDTQLLAKAGGFYFDKAQFNAEIPNVANGNFIFFNQDHNFDLKLAGVSGIGSIPIPNTQWQSKGVRYPNVFGTGIHFEVYANNKGVTHQIRFDQPPSNPNVDFVVNFEVLNMPDTLDYHDRGGGAPVVIDPSANLDISNKVIRLRNSAGSAITYLSQPKCWDSGDIVKTLPVKIIFKQVGGKQDMLKVIPKEIFQNATYPIFADHPADYDGQSGSSDIVAGPDTWANNRNATAGSALWDSINLECRTYGIDPTNYISRIALLFDTAALGGGDTISSVILYVTGASSKVDGGDLIQVVDGTFSDPVVLGDFDLVGDAIDNPTLMHAGTGVTIAAWPITGIDENVSFTFNTDGENAIVKGGTSKFGLRLSSDNDAAGWPNIQKAKISNTTQSGLEPHLDITTSTGLSVNVNESITLAENIQSQNPVLGGINVSDCTKLKDQVC